MLRLRYSLPLSVLSFSLLPLTAAISTAAQAQDTNNQLEPVTVTTTRGNSEAGETPQKITVINRDEIEQQMAITNDQAQVLS
ncbi:MAG TPA: TonB-dependent receptor, partial [Alcanivorax sp.]|nr:TonB-dependent receptor [Alcanivorax sp.]